MKKPASRKPTAGSAPQIVRTASLPKAKVTKRDRPMGAEEAAAATATLLGALITTGADRMVHGLTAADGLFRIALALEEVAKALREQNDGDAAPLAGD